MFDFLKKPDPILGQIREKERELRRPKNDPFSHNPIFTHTAVLQRTPENVMQALIAYTKKANLLLRDNRYSLTKLIL